MSYAIQHLASILQAQLIIGNEHQEISDLLIDSRSLGANEYSLFFALKTERNDGHKYIADAYKKGVRNFVVEPSFNATLSNFTANFIVVANSLEALQKLAQHHRNQFNLNTVGITGSNGKTTVKEWLYEVCHETFNTVRSPKSYNSQVGVPLSLWLIEAQNNLGIFEAGISAKNEMASLGKMIQPTAGIFTNIGNAHNEGFESEAEKILEKLQLFDACNWFVYRADYATLHSIIQTSTHSKKAISWSNTGIEGSIKVSFEPSAKGSNILILGLADFIGNESNTFQFEVRFTDKASLENAVYAALVALKLGVLPAIVKEKMELLGNLPMRLELKEGSQGCLLINDTYNSDLDSLQIALDFLAQQKKLQKRTIILSDILQSGKSSLELYQQVADYLQHYGISKIVAIGPEITKHKALFENFELKTFENLGQFLKAYQTNWFSNELVLIKGARAFQFEKISALLEQKVHGTVMEINLSAMLANLNFYRNRLPKGAKLMAMVKAFSYGSGSFEVAQLLQYHRVDCLAVAYADEGVELRNGGITLPIMVMNADEAAFETLIRFELEPEIYSLQQLKQFIATVNSLEISPDKVIPIHLKLETGMHRLGFETEELQEVCALILDCPFVKVASVFSHLVAADSAEHDEFTHQQAAIFQANSATISELLGYTFLKHLVNTAGQFRFPEYSFDMVRLGIGLYGIGSTQEEKQHLETVCSLYTTVSQVKKLKQGDSVGYNRKFVATKNSHSATLAIGYADGFSRKMSNGVGRVYFKGYKLPIIGNVCMDMCMIETDEQPIEIGDRVEIFGENISVYDLAKKLETIPYEVLTSVSRRVKRVYFQE